MVKVEEVLELVDEHMNRILTVAEAALSPPQFQPFRKIVLDEFGQRGLASELRELELAGRK